MEAERCSVLAYQVASFVSYPTGTQRVTLMTQSAEVISVTIAIVAAKIQITVIAIAVIMVIVVVSKVTMVSIITTASFKVVVK